MKIIGVIPARYSSTRFPGKPLADIHGNPMIWWVYQQLNSVKGIDKVYVALDDDRVVDACKKYNIDYVMTSPNHSTHLDRLGEFCQQVHADFYININGDEPLMKPEYIEPMIPHSINPSEFYAANAMTKIKRPVEITDVARIKVVTDMQGYCMYLGRTPIPYPQAMSDFDYFKFVGIQCFSKSALMFCATTPRGKVESIEDIDEFRFLENGKKIKFLPIDVELLSVDTPKDLEKAKKMLPPTPEYYSI